MEYGVNQYKGLNLDTSYDSITGGFYIDALDIRISTTKGESQGSITNRKGNSLFFDLDDVASSIPITGTRAILGSTSIRNTIVLFVADDSNQNGWIFTVTYDEQDNTFSSITEIYANTNLYFSKNNPIEAAGRFESGTIQRVYWTDYNNYLRTINIADPNVSSIPPDLIDLFPNITYTQPLLTAIQGTGSLKVGVYQYAYRLITNDGKQTLISPPGALIHTSTSSEFAADVSQYSGNAQGVAANKAHQITIDTSEYADFESIELISIFHESFTGTPLVQSVETKGIDGANSVTFLHIGNEETIIDLDTFTYTTKQYAFKTCKTLTPKDNSLVVANIKGSYFDIDELLTGESFDAKTARYNSAGNLPYPLTGTPEEIEEKKLKNAFNNEVDSTVYTTLQKPELGYNSDAHWDKEWHTDKQFKYQSNGSTLGGDGANIRYTFYLHQTHIDFTSNPEKQSLGYSPGSVPSLGDGYTYTNQSFENNASPFLSGLIRGYKRGETYRFGIVFYNKKGETSFVKYIGDIKFPDISDTDSFVNNSGTAYFPVANTPDDINTYGYQLGIKFEIDFSTCPTLFSEITGYQIVRLERNNDDIRRLCSGIIKVAHKPNVLDTPGGNDDYDLRPDGTEDIVHLLSYNKNYLFDGSGVDSTLPALGYNGNFATINNTSVQSKPFEVLGAYITFYSPEVSYDFGDDIGIINSQSMLLITGKYSKYYSNHDVANYSFHDQPAGIDTNYIKAFLTPGFTESLGTTVIDLRRKLRSTEPVNKSTAIGAYATFERGVEYIKQWKENAHVLFDQNAQDAGILINQRGIAIGKYNGFNDAGTSVSYYFRNFYAYLGESGDSLNWHVTAPMFPLYPLEWAKGASGITGSMERIAQDPILGTPITPTPTHHFDTGKFPTALDPSSAEGPVACTTFTDGLLSTPMVDIMIPRNEYYGGFTQDALESNIFIPASSFIQKPTSGTSDTFTVFGGDIFVDMWTFQESTAYLEEAFYQSATGQAQQFTDNRTSTITLPIESKINLSLPYGATVQRGVKKNVSGGTSGVLNEKWRQETDNNETTYGKSLNMYINTYNEVYSKENKDLAFFVKPAAFNNASNVNDIRAYISNVKINQEEIDSWTQFGINNYYDVDDHGPINKIVDWRNFIYYFQDTGVGRYSINPRAVVATADGIPTELGSGEGFQDHIYISTEHGSIHQWAVAPTDTGIYYFDATHKKQFVLTDGNNPLSEVKGLHSLFNEFDGEVLLRKENGGDNPILGNGVHIAKDKVNDEVIMTFMNTKKVIKGEQPPEFVTLAYDELFQEFSSFYSNNSPMYIENNGVLLSVNRTDKSEVYLENSGDWGSFYGNTTEAYIKLVLNKDADINKILRFIEFNSIVRDDDKVIDRTQTITGFRVETEYQDTGKITDLSRIKRRFDKWRLKIPRNSLSSKKDRLRSTHFILTLYFDNTYNKQLILNRIIHFFNKQMY